jgi:hypothetical protein
MVQGAAVASIMLIKKTDVVSELYEALSAVWRGNLAMEPVRSAVVERHSRASLI